MKPCTGCGGELILTNVAPDETVAVRGVENHTFVCSTCHVTERRVVFTKHGREDDTPPMPLQVAPRINRTSTEQEEHVAAPGFFGRVMARLRAHPRRHFDLCKRDTRQPSQPATD
jgi:hypothetical protein